MSLAVDRDMIIDYVYNGEAPVSTFVAPTWATGCGTP